MWSCLVSVLPFILPVTVSAYNHPHTPSLCIVSQAAAMFIFRLLYCPPVSPVCWPGWCLAPRPRRRRRQRQSEPEWSESACYQPGPGPEPGNIISASRPGGGEKGRQRESGPGWFYYRRGLWLRPTSREWEMTTTKHLPRYQLSLFLLRSPACVSASQSAGLAWPPIQGWLFCHFFVYLEKFSSFPLFCATASACYKLSNKVSSDYKIQSESENSALSH